MSIGHSNPRLSQCSFCDKPNTRSEIMFSSRGQAAVCYNCIRVLSQVVADEMEEEAEEALLFLHLAPRDIYADLDAYVVAQERAKKILSVAVYNHFKRIRTSGSSEVEIQKANILLIGPTGCGKTLLAESLAKTLDVPFAVCDATSLTESGYVGEDVENILLRLIQAADWDIAKAQRGIIYIDEMDKIARKEGVNRSITRDVSGEGVQQELLKIIEGCIANVPPQGGRKHPHQDFLQIDTRNILFICGGAFEGIDRMVEDRAAAGSARLGFLAGSRSASAVPGGAANNVTPDDLLEFGLIPEMVGRLPVSVMLEPLERDDLVRVLTEPKNSIVKQYQHLFKMDGVELEFTQAALEAAADRALEHSTGARCLRYVIEDTLLDVMYDLPSLTGATRCVVDRASIEGIELPRLYGANGDEVPLPTEPLRESA